MTFADASVLPQIPTETSRSCAFDLIVSNRVNLYYTRHLDSNTVGYRYNAVQYTMLLHAVLQQEQRNISKILNSQKIPYHGRTTGCVDVCCGDLGKITSL